jgi:hypothetical protein
MERERMKGKREGKIEDAKELGAKDSGQGIV